jgi:hypothetical protein
VGGIVIVSGLLGVRGLFLCAGGGYRTFPSPYAMIIYVKIYKIVAL